MWCCFYGASSLFYRDYGLNTVVNSKNLVVNGTGYICKYDSQTVNRTTGNVTLTELLHRYSKPDTIMEA